MTPEKQRLAIAEVCPSLFIIGLSVFDLPHIYWKQDGKFQGAAVDPLNDLDAMHEAEKVLTEPEQFAAYGDHLSHILNDAHRGEFRWLGPTSYHYAHATAAQHAEALLRALGKWEESTLDSPAEAV